MLRLDKQSGNYVKENSIKYEITCAVKLIYYKAWLYYHHH